MVSSRPMSPPLALSKPPVRPADLHPQAPDLLRRLYAAWLAMPHPDPRRRGKCVASGAVRKAFAGEGVRLAKHTAKVWEELETTWLTHPERVWVWSDLHLFHTNILRYSSRPFGSIQEMHDTLWANAFASVGDTDWLLFVGDLSFGQPDATAAWMASLPGRKVNIMGNHDVQGACSKVSPFHLGFEAIAESQDWRAPKGLVDAEGQPIDRLWITHYPLYSGWVPEGVAHVHGHLHQHRLPGRLWNASVEQLDYRPRRLAEWLREPRLPATDLAPPAEDL